MGLLAPAARNAGGYRLYDRGAMVRLRGIRRLQGLGLSLEEIRRLIQVEQAAENCGPVRESLIEVLSTQIQRVEQQVEGLQLFVQDLKQYLALLHAASAIQVPEHCDVIPTGEQPRQRQ